MKKKPIILSKDEVLDAVASFRKSKILLTAVELDIFSFLSNSPADLSTITYELNTEIRATYKLLKSLVMLGYLEEFENKYQNTEHAEIYLNKKSNDYLTELSQLQEIWEDWHSLTDSIYSGHLNKRKDNRVRLLYTDISQQVLEALYQEGGSSVMEIGTSLSLRSPKFINNNIKFKIKSFDSIERIEAAMKALGSNLLEDSVELIPADIKEADFGSNYDLVFASGFLASNSVVDNIHILSRIHSCLKSEGKFVIHEKIINDNGIHTNSNLYHSIDLTIKSKCGELFTQADIKVMLNAAGFFKIQEEYLNEDEAIFTAVK